MALKAIKTFDVGSGAWKELAVMWGSKAGFFSVGQMSEAAVPLGSVESWLNSAGGGSRTFLKLSHLLFSIAFGGSILLHHPVREYRAVGGSGELG